MRQRSGNPFSSLGDACQLIAVSSGHCSHSVDDKRFRGQRCAVQKTSSKKNADDLVLEALEKVLLCAGPSLLVSSKKSDTAALFSDENGERGRAIQKCLAGSQPLLKVARTEEVESGKQPFVKRFVSITPHGIDYFFSRLALERAGELLATASQQAAKELQTLERQLENLLSARQQAIENVTALTEQLGATVERFQNALRDGAEKSALLKTRLDRLPIPQALLPESPEPPRLRRPATEEEGLFRQRAAQELVFAWQDADRAARHHIERALLNLGAEPIGSPGERTKFSGQLHSSETPAFTGDLIEVKESGWVLRDESGGYLLAHAKVTVIPQQKD